MYIHKSRVGPAAFCDDTVTDDQRRFLRRRAAARTYPKNAKFR